MRAPFEIEGHRTSVGEVAPANWTQRPFELPGWVGHTVDTGDGPLSRWQISVGLPRLGPRVPVRGNGLPALYLLDGRLTFVVAAHIAQTVHAFSLGQLRPVAVVGISPATEDTGRLTTQRIRDLTPTSGLPSRLKAHATYGAGGAPDMLALIREVIAPKLESIYPLDPLDRGLGGISLGGLFACWALVSQPAGFRRYLARLFQ